MLSRCFSRFLTCKPFKPLIASIVSLQKFGIKNGYQSDPIVIKFAQEKDSARLEEYLKLKYEANREEQLKYSAQLQLEHQTPQLQLGKIIATIMI